MPVANCQRRWRALNTRSARGRVFESRRPTMMGRQVWWVVGLMLVLLFTTCGSALSVANPFSELDGVITTVTRVALNEDEKVGAGQKGECTFPTQRIDCGALSCNATTHQCGTCRWDSDCFNKGYECLSGGTCIMKRLSFSAKTLIAPLVAILVCSVAVVAGVGGGAILVPAYSLILGLPIADAVPMSQATIFGQSFSNSFLLLPRAHPRRTRPVVNYEYLVLLLPFLLTGTMLGSIGNKVTPAWFRVCLLFLLLIFIMYRLVRKAIRQRRMDALSDKKRVCGEEEGKAGEAEEGKTADSAAVPQPLVVSMIASDAEEIHSLVLCFFPNFVKRLHNNVQTAHAPHGVSITEEAKEEEPDEEEGCGEGEMIRSSARDGKPQYPPLLLTLTAVAFAAQLAFTALSSEAVGLVACGEWPYWLVHGGATVWGVLFATVYREYLALLKSSSDVARRRDGGEIVGAFSAVPFPWNNVTTIVFPLVSLIAGGAASMLGVGGGMILNFLLLEAGLAPEEVSATGGIATMLVSAQSIAVFLIEGQLNWEYGLLFACAGVVSTAVGQLLFVRPIKKRGLTYLFIASLIAILAASLVTLGGYGVYETIEISAYGGSLAFGELCRAKT